MLVILNRKSHYARLRILNLNILKANSKLFCFLFSPFPFFLSVFSLSLCFSPAQNTTNVACNISQRNGNIISNHNWFYTPISNIFEILEAKCDVVGNVTLPKMWNKFQVENLCMKSCNNLYFDQFLVESCLFPCSSAFQHLLGFKLWLHTLFLNPFRNTCSLLLLFFCCSRRSLW